MRKFARERIGSDGVRSLTLTILLVPAVLLTTAVLRADDDLARARAKFSEGVDLYRAGDDLGARAAFLEAEKSHHAAVTTYNLALVEERLGRVQAAVDDYERYLAETGENGQFSSAAAIAVAELRRKSGKVRIDTTPEGAAVFVDGAALTDATPVTVLLLAGKHHISVEWKDARAAVDADVQAGAPQNVRIEHPPIEGANGAGGSPASSADGGAATGNGGPTVDGGARSNDGRTTALPKEFQAPQPAPPDPEVSGLVFGGGFYAFPFAFIKSGGGSSPVSSEGVFGGISAEVGYAFAEHAYVGLRGYAAIGPSCRTIFGAHLASVGPVIEYHATSKLWLGVGVNGGNGVDCKDSSTLSTDLEFSPMVDASYAITSQSYGQWLVSVGIGYFFTNPTTNGYGLLYAPIGFGPRFY